jgi:hypothetical protein
MDEDGHRGPAGLYEAPVGSGIAADPTRMNRHVHHRAGIATERCTRQDRIEALAVQHPRPGGEDVGGHEISDAPTKPEVIVFDHRDDRPEPAPTVLRVRTGGLVRRPVALCVDETLPLHLPLLGQDASPQLPRLVDGEDPRDAPGLRVRERLELLDVHIHRLPPVDGFIDDDVRKAQRFCPQTF